MVNELLIFNTRAEKLLEDIVEFYLFFKNPIKVSKKITFRISKLFYVKLNGLIHKSTFVKQSLFQKAKRYVESYTMAIDYECFRCSFLEPTTTSKSCTIPMVIFQLHRISQTSNWCSANRRTKQ
jgi:hypothetical protein